MLVCQYVCLALVEPSCIVLFSIAWDCLHRSSLLFITMRLYPPAVTQFFRYHVGLTSASVLFSLLGEIHPGGAREPGAGQEVFCTGTQAEQQKHEGLVWPVYGESQLAPKLKKTNTTSFSSWHTEVVLEEQRCFMPQKWLVTADSDLVPAPYLGKASLCIISVT